MGLPALQIEDLPHYTYDDYVNWEGRWELIHGIPYAMAPAPAIRHQEISGEIAVQLHKLLAHCKLCKPLLPVDWQIAEDTIVQPDNLVVCGENIEGKKLTITPVLVFEILSPSTGRKDRVLKYRLYREAGVKYFCIVNPEIKSAEAFTLKSSEYEKTEDFQDGKVTFDLGPCKIAFDFNEIFKK
ncbi:MAG: Uma2 family endonuclease [Candidatus Aminicenantes bacterium]|nr:Uma2 family endonuclease [Candidatus Aminicenantes bacterium]